MNYILKYVQSVLFNFKKSYNINVEIFQKSVPRQYQNWRTNVGRNSSRATGKKRASIRINQAMKKQTLEMTMTDSRVSSVAVEAAVEVAEEAEEGEEDMEGIVSEPR